MLGGQAAGIEPGTDQEPHHDSHHLASTYVIADPYNKQGGIIIPILELINGGLEKGEHLSKLRELESAKVGICTWICLPSGPDHLTAPYHPHPSIILSSLENTTVRHEDLIKTPDLVPGPYNPNPCVCCASICTCAWTTPNLKTSSSFHVAGPLPCTQEA